MDGKTQIKFENPDIDGTSRPVVVTLEQETPLEGEGTRSDGGTFIWHKWICTNETYFLASDTLDAMLKILPDKMNKTLTIEKVANTTGNGYPYFQLNGMTKDELIAEYGTNKAKPTSLESAIIPPIPSTAPASDSMGSNDAIMNKLDQIIDMLSKLNKESIPF